jgi:hypothetical protein
MVDASSASLSIYYGVFGDLMSVALNIAVETTMVGLDGRILVTRVVVRIRLTRDRKPQAGVYWLTNKWRAHLASSSILLTMMKSSGIFCVDVNLFTRILVGYSSLPRSDYRQHQS